MPKRFTDTEKWRDRWFRALPPEHKLAWGYLCDNCDCAGIIELDSELADFQIGAPTDFDSLIDSCEGRIERISGGKLWLVGFVEFQYGQLSPGSKPHQAVIKRLEKAGLLSRVGEGYGKGTDTLKDKEKEEDKAKVKGGCKGGKFSPPTAAEVTAYCTERGNSVDATSFVNFYESKGWMVGKNKMKDWKACVRTWERRDDNKIGPGQKYDADSGAKAGATIGW